MAKVYADRAISGGSAFRDGFQQLRADAETGLFDVVVCEALDRLGRKLSDVAELHDRLQFHRIVLHAVHLGEITTMHVGLLRTMAQLYLSDLRDKTKRGQLGRALAGKIPGGLAYGYDLIDGRTGDRRINAAEARVVHRIFRDYAADNSPRAFVKVLNAEAVPGPGATRRSAASSIAAPASSTTPSMSGASNGTAAPTSRTLGPVSGSPGLTYGSCGR